MMARKSGMEQVSVVADTWNLKLETAKLTRPLGQEIYHSLYFYPFRLKAVLGKNDRFPD